MTKEEWKREWRWHFGFGWSEWPLREERLFQLLKLETWNLKLEINGFCFVWEMGEDNVIDFIHKTQVHYRPRFSSFPLGFFLKIINKSHSLIAHAMSVLICTLSFFSTANFSFISIQECYILASILPLKENLKENIMCPKKNIYIYIYIYI